jgi:hypothetical protein
VADSSRKCHTALAGFLTYGQVLYGLSRLGLALQASELVPVLAPFDRNHQGAIQFADFYRLVFPEGY